MGEETIPVASFDEWQLHQMILVEFSDLLPAECYMGQEEKGSFETDLSENRIKASHPENII